VPLLRTAIVNEILLVLPLPKPALSPNSRAHWGTRAGAIKRYRIVAYATALEAGGQNLRWPRAVAQATFYWPDRRRRDVANADASLKAAWDGIVDAGLIPDDRAEVLTHEPTRFAVDRRRPRVEIQIVNLGNVRVDCPQNVHSR